MFVIKKAQYDKSADDQKASQSPADAKKNQPKTPENATRKNQPKMPEISTKKTTNISLMKYLNLQAKGGKSKRNYNKNNIQKKWNFLKKLLKHNQIMTSDKETLCQ